MAIERSRQFNDPDEENAAAHADFQRDSVKDYGRPHPEVKGSGRGRTNFKRVLAHHSAEEFNPNCPDCRVDKSKGIHPKA